MVNIEDPQYILLSIVHIATISLFIESVSNITKFRLFQRDHAKGLEATRRLDGGIAGLNGLHGQTNVVAVESEFENV